MAPSPQESVLSCRKRLFEELILGRSYAEKLQGVFRSLGKNPNVDGELTRDLVEKVRRSFDESLLVLSHEVELKEDFQVVDVTSLRPVKRGKQNSSEGSEGSVGSSLATRRGRRGCYKRRSNGETWTEFTQSMNADHHQWRKYGQKSIQNTAHPRNYFRCTHKTDQGCLATKQVQKVSNDPLTFCTVYQGHHTCNDNPQHKPHEIVFDGNGSKNQGNGDSPLLLRFDRSNTISAPLKKEVTGEELFRDKGTAVLSASSNNGYFSLFGPGGDQSALSSDPGDATYAGHHGSYMDMVLDWDGPANFEFDYGSPGRKVC